MPTAYLIAGPNDAGKTTFARDYLPNEVGCIEFINNDLIAAGLAPLQPDRAHLRAGRIVISELNQLAKNLADFGFETTLAGRTYAAFLKELREAGYAVHLYYLWLPDVELDIQRVAERVRQGGHDVPVEDIRRRYQRSLVNFFQLYRPLATTWAIIDNSGDQPRVVVRYNDKQEEVLDTRFYQMMQQRYGEYAPQPN